MVYRFLRVQFLPSPGSRPPVAPSPPVPELGADFLVSHLHLSFLHLPRSFSVTGVSDQTLYCVLSVSVWIKTAGQRVQLQETKYVELDERFTAPVLPC